MKLLICAFCILGILIKQRSAIETNDWWVMIRQSIEFPCWANAISQLVNSSVMEEASADSGTVDYDGDSYEVSPDGAPRNRDCVSFDRSAVIALSREAEDLVGSLLQHKRARRWVRGWYADLAEDKRCALSLTVTSRRRTGLKKTETKIVEDLIQLESFAHYLTRAKSTLRSRKDAQVRENMLALATVLRSLNCRLRPAIDEPLLAHITRGDTPIDLREASKGPVGRVEAYVIMEKIQENLRRLPGTYRQLNLCP